MAKGTISRFAEEQIEAYSKRFSTYSDQQVRDALAHEQGLRAWCSQRSYYLAALRAACEKRKIPYHLCS